MYTNLTTNVDAILAMLRLKRKCKSPERFFLEDATYPDLVFLYQYYQYLKQGFPLALEVNL